MQALNSRGSLFRLLHSLIFVLTAIGIGIPATSVSAAIQGETCTDQTGPDDEEGDPECEDEANNDEADKEKQDGEEDGDPVDLNSGAFSYDADLIGVSFGGFDVNFHLSYMSSAVGWPSSVAPRWSHSFDQKIVLKVEKGPCIAPYPGPGDVLPDIFGEFPGGIHELGPKDEEECLQTWKFKLFHYDNLIIDEYELDDTEYDRWNPISSSNKKLIADEQAYHGVEPQLPERFFMRSADGTIVEFERPYGFLYDILCRVWDTATYRPVSMTFPSGEQVLFSHEWVAKTTFCGDMDSYRRMKWIYSANGASLELGYGAGGFLESVKDHTGRQVDLIHDGRGNLTEIRGPEVTTADDDTPYVPTTKFNYGDFVPMTQKLGHNIVSIVSPNEMRDKSKTPYVVNTWNENQGQVVQQHYGGKNASGVDAGGKFSFIRSYGVIDHTWFEESSRTLVIDPNGNARLSIFDQWGVNRLLYTFQGRLDHPIDVTTVQVDDFVDVDPVNYMTGGSLIGADAVVGSRLNDSDARVTRYDYAGYGLIGRVETESSITEYTYDFGSPDRHQRFNRIKTVRMSKTDSSDRIVTATVYDPIFNVPRVEFSERGAASYLPPNSSPITDQWERYSTTYILDYQEGLSGSVGGIVDKWEIDLNQNSTVNVLSSEGINFPPLLFGLTDVEGNGNGSPESIRGQRIRETRIATVIVDPRAPSPSFELQESTHRFDYNSNGRLRTATDALGSVTKYYYYPTSDPAGLAGGQLSTDEGGFLGKVVEVAGSSIERETILKYDALGNVVELTGPRGDRSIYEYDDRRLRIRTTLPRNLLVTSEYDANGNLVAVSQSNDLPNWTQSTPADLTLPSLPTSRTEMVYDILDHKIEQREIKEEGAAVYKYRFDRAENLVLTLLPNWINEPNNVRATLFDEWNRPFAEGHGGLPAGFAGLAAHSHIGELVQLATEPTGYSENRMRYFDGLLVEFENGSGGVSRNFHDGFGRLFAKEDPLGNRTEFTLDIAGMVEVTKSYDANDTLLAESSMEYDEFGRTFANHRKVLDSASVLIDGPLSPGDGMVTNRRRFGPGGHSLIEVSDELVWSEMSYDQLGRMVFSTDAGGNTWTNRYDKANNRIYESQVRVATDGTPSLTSEEWSFHDLEDNLVADAIRRGSDALVSRYIYDQASNLVLSTNARGAIASGTDLSSLDYSGQHSLAGFPVPSLSINEHGNATLFVTDARGNTVETHHVYRALGEGSGAIATSAGGGDGRASNYASYNLNGLLETQTDDSGSTTNYHYDTLNRVNRVDYADGTSRLFSYTGTGKLDRALDQNGTMLDRNYDGADRISNILVVPATGVVGTKRYEYEFDGMGRTKEGRTYEGGALSSTTSFLYDSMSNVVERNTNGFISNAIYDGDGNPIKMTYPSGRFVDIERADALRRTTAMSRDNASQPYVSFDYLGASWGLGRRLENGLTTRYNYDSVGDVLGLTATSPAGTLLDIDSTWSRAGSRLTRTEAATGINRMFSYDSMEQMDLALVTHPTLAPRLIRYNLDSMGSRDSLVGGPLAGPWGSSGASASVHEYTSAPTRSFTHDANGNLVEETTSGGTPQVLSMAYDSKNFLIQADWGIAGDTYDFERDAFGYRILERKTTSSGAVGETHLTYLPNGAMAEERDLQGNIARTFFYGNNTETPVVQDRNIPGAVQSLYSLLDDLNSVIALTLDSGAIAERYEYEDFGEPVDYQTWSPITSSSFRNRFLFHGKRMDWGIGLYDSNARMYDPETGRFTSRDPMGVWFDPVHRGNGYSFAGNSPWTYVDPTGFQTAVASSGPGASVRGNVGHHGSASGRQGPQGDVKGDTEHHGSSSGKKSKSGKRLSDAEYQRQERELAKKKEAHRFMIKVLNDRIKYKEHYELTDEQVGGIYDVLWTDYDSLEEEMAAQEAAVRYLLADAKVKNGDASKEMESSLAFWDKVGGITSAAMAAADSWSGGLTTSVSELVGGEEFKEAHEGLKEAFPKSTEAGALVGDFIGGGKGRLRRANCFVAGTQVLTADGLEEIEDVETGDWVLAWNFETRAPEYRPVLHPIVGEVPFTLMLEMVNSAGERTSIELTAEHPLRTTDDLWKEALAVEVGERLVTLDGECEVVCVMRIDGKQKVYNFEVQGLHCYFVSSMEILAHNDSRKSTLPRADNGNYLPDPKATGAHTTLGVRKGRKGDYTQGATFDKDGKFQGRTDVTDHGRPSNHANPHFHPATSPNSTGPGQPIPNN